jgi:hypothetical protein
MYPCKYDIEEEENVQHEHTKKRYVIILQALRKEK